ncbi:hypothetical protein LR48_Vigan04g186300 [Vigna angularis]|uniref:Uncharacterized protein n=1 Tax=Phaseolus angularis TaxID=3914 RepID=A0A0L9UFI0_PHAAN|nr:hypothetical protein LR48_Vigan04g186300 [Vigna angularis]
MEGLHNMDGEFEAENLDTFFDWDDDQFIPTFLQSDTSITALQDLNLMENFNFQTEVPPVNPSAVMESIDQAETQVQLTDPTSWFSQGPSSTMAFGFVPNPLPSPPTTSVLNGTQLINSLPSLEELMFDGEGPSFPGLDVTQTACSNQLPDFQDQNVLALEDLHFNGEQNTFDINNFNVNQSSSVNPALVHPNPVQVSPANETYSSGLFAPSQRPEFFPVQNHISDSLAAWNSRYSPFQDQRHHPQVTMPNIQGQQSRASMQQWSEPSEAIRRILNMNPSRLVRRPIAAEQIQGSHLSERARYEPPSRGRPPKRRFEEYFQRERVSSEIGNAGTTPTSRQALHIPYSYRNAIAPNPPSAPRFSKSLYDIEYERKGHPIDPLLRLFKRSPDN